MKTNHCYVCGADIGKYGWSQHVNKEKRKHGKDVYIKLKALRNIRSKPRGENKAVLSTLEVFMEKGA